MASSSTSVSGLVSGLDTATIISQLMQLEAQPQTNLKNQVSTYKTQVSSLQTVNAKLAAVATKASDLAQVTSWTPVKSTSSSTDVTVTASTTATPASLTFKVLSVASGSSVKFATTGTAGSTVTTAPDLKITRDDGTTWTSSSWTGTGTLQDLATALNDPTSGVKATLVRSGLAPDGTTPTYQLQVASSATGASSGFAVTSGGAAILGGVVGTSAEQTYATSATDTVTPVTTADASYTVSFTGGRAPVTFSTGTGSMQDVADAINQAGGGVTAKLVNAGTATTPKYRLQVDSTDGSTFNISDGTATPFLGGVFTTGAGKDASIDLGGQPLTSSSNTISGLMPGVDVTLGANASGSVTVTVAHDTQALSGKVQSMVDAVNSALDDISSLTSYDASTKTAGILAGESSLRTVRDQLLSSVSSGIGGQSLASVGIQTDKTGRLTFDATKFADAYNADPTGTAKKFTGSVSYDSTVGTGSVKLQGSTWRTVEGSYAVVAGPPPTIGGTTATTAGTWITGAVGGPTEGLTLEVSSGASRTVTYSQGIAAKLETLAQRASNSTDGTVTAAINGRNSSIDRMNSDIADWDVRLAARQTALQTQYAALEVALGKLQDQSTWLAGQIKSLPSPSSGN